MENWMNGRLIIKFKTFEEITQFKEGNLKVLYKDNNLTVVVPLTSEASAISSRGTEWCSKTKHGYDMCASTNILFRFLFRNGYKLRLTWSFGYEDRFTWGSGGKKYIELRGKHPFNDFQSMEDNIKKEYNDRLQDIEDGDLYYKQKYYIHDMNTYDNLPDDIKKLTSKEYYKNEFNFRMEIIKRIKMIPEEAKSKVIEYRKNNKRI